MLYYCYIHPTYILHFLYWFRKTMNHNIGSHKVTEFQYYIGTDNNTSHPSRFVVVNPLNPHQARTDVEDKMQLSLDCCVSSELQEANRFGSVCVCCKITEIENLPS